MPFERNQWIDRLRSAGVARAHRRAEAVKALREPTYEELVAVLRQLVDPTDHVTCLDHGAADDEAGFFIVIDEAAWLTKAEVAVLARALRHPGLAEVAGIDIGGGNG